MKLILFSFLLCVSVLQAQNENAYKDGEWLSFKIKYGWFKASTATLKINDTVYDGKNLFHIVGKGKSVGLLDVFFKVRDQYETYIDDEGLPHKFVRDINEGGYKKHKELYFDHDKNRVKVKDFKYNRTDTFDFKPKSQDMLSAFYKLRNLIDPDNLEKGQEFLLDMFFDDENYNFKTKFLGEEIVDTKFGKVKCLKFRPYVMADRVFEAEESLTFWVSADENKVPIKIEAKLAVGSLVAELENFKNLAHSFKIVVD
ncbi:MAG: DUF3108 domain-containing protein [Psychroflexus sp.]